MTLITSISGIRGTIGGLPEKNLTPLDAVRFAAAFGSWLREKFADQPIQVVIGRDARLSGAMLQHLVQNTLIGLGIDVIDLGLSTTPTVEMSVVFEKAQGGIILTASHNPKEWNALKLLNEKGELINASEGERLLKMVSENDFTFVPVTELGKYFQRTDAIAQHISAVLDLPLVNVPEIRNAGLTVVVDAVNSTGGIALPPLLEQLGVKVIPIYCDPTGHFPHNPEPLKEHLTDLCREVVAQDADLGIVVDPDVDRLAFVDETGEMFGEEYTLVACADYVLSKTPGDTVSNMSSTRALRSITEKYGKLYHASAVGEVNVVEKMKEVSAVIGGEGNGGIIYPALHYGRDALVGIGLFLSLLAEKKQSVSSLKASYPLFFMSKKKINLQPKLDVDAVLNTVAQQHSGEDISTIDGVKIDFKDRWVHLRKSNTEPIIRIYTEAPSQHTADALADDFIALIKNISEK